MVNHDAFIEQVRAQSIVVDEANPSPQWKAVRNAWCDAIKADRDEIKAVYVWARERVQLDPDAIRQMQESGIDPEVVQRGLRGANAVGMFLALIMQGMTESAWDGTGHRFYHTTTFQSVLIRMYVMEKVSVSREIASSVDDLIAEISNNPEA